MRNITSFLPEILNWSTFPPKSLHHLRILLLLLKTKMKGTDECFLIVDVEVSCWHDQLRQAVSQSMSYIIANQFSLQILINSLKWYHLSHV